MIRRRALMICFAALGTIALQPGCGGGDDDKCGPDETFIFVAESPVTGKEIGTCVPN